MSKDVNDFDNEIKKTIEKQPYMFNGEIPKKDEVKSKDNNKPLPTSFPF
jgi:hypothetical protein